MYTEHPSNHQEQPGNHIQTHLYIKRTLLQLHSNTLATDHNTLLDLNSSVKWSRIMIIKPFRIQYMSNSLHHPQVLFLWNLKATIPPKGHLCTTFCLHGSIWSSNENGLFHDWNSRRPTNKTSLRTALSQGERIWTFLRLWKGQASADLEAIHKETVKSRRCCIAKLFYIKAKNLCLPNKFHTVSMESSAMSLSRSLSL